MKYFIYSANEYKKTKDLYEKSGLKYIPGEVVVNGEVKKFTNLIEDTSDEFRAVIDSVVIATFNDDEMSTVIYKMPAIK